MLALSDVSIARFLPYFANTGVPVAFLVPTPNGYRKSIMDATAPVRKLLLDAHVHNYGEQGQGPANKVTVPAYFVNCDTVTKSTASLYRPVTKKGDPRIWFANLRRYCQPRNLLAIIVLNEELYVFNLSKPEVASGLAHGGFAASVLQEAADRERAIADELLGKLRSIRKQGFLPSVTYGDPGVGDTLEHALGISRNNSKLPDYKGIELKTSRLTRNGSVRAKTRSTLFTKVPEIGASYREIVERYGKWQVPRGETLARLQLYETFRCSRANAYDLILDVDADNDRLNIFHVQGQDREFVAGWNLETLREALSTKHRETFWVQAVSEDRDGVEYFRYDKVLHTKGPNVALLAPLLATDKITVDLAAHFKPDGKWRDHGVLFKMLPDDLPLLLGEPTEYVL